MANDFFGQFTVFQELSDDEKEAVRRMRAERSRVAPDDNFKPKVLEDTSFVDSASATTKSSPTREADFGENSVTAKTRKPLPVPKSDFVISEPNESPQEAKRKSEISDLMKRYDEASRRDAYNRNQDAYYAQSMALRNPAAARTVIDASQLENNQNVQSITGGLGAQSSLIGNQTRQLGQMQTDRSIALSDQEMDPQSSVSRLYREQLKLNNIDVPENASAADIKRVFPFLKADISRDTAIRGQDLTDEQKRLKREQDEKLTGEKLTAAQKRAETMAGASIQRGRESNASQMFVAELKAEASQNTAAGNAARRELNDLKQKSIIGWKFSNPYKKIPSSQDHTSAAKIAGALPAIQSLGGRIAERLESDPRNLAVSEDGRSLMQQMNTVVKIMNKGLMAEGVTNGKDMEIGLEMASGGDVNGFAQWLNADGANLMRDFISNMEEYAGTAMRGYGYEQGDETIDLGDVVGRGSGSGGGSSGRVGGLDPSSEKSLSDLATGGRGTSISPNKRPIQTIQAPLPAPPPIVDPDTQQTDMVTFILPDGTGRKISRKSAMILQSKGRGKIQ